MSKKLAVIREALRNAEVKQATQLQIALAADARAMTLCVACAGFSGVLLALIGSGTVGPVIPVAMSAVSFFLASAVAAYAARPIGFSCPGQDFSDFEGDISEDRSLTEVLVELGRHLDEDARENEWRSKRNANALMCAMSLAAAAPFIGLLAAVIG
ncbi:MAG: hypothetical protein ACK5L6_09480 [Anaerorhabdus sp.]|uniref:hypothetical protein n=1 Tax=Anaerorhabdus sp. TaxID=1872524 RepID=UPI003A8C82D0